MNKSDVKTARVNDKKVKEPLFHVAKRDEITFRKKFAIYAISIVLSLFLGGLICTIASGGEGNPFSFFMSLFSGIFGSSRKIWYFCNKPRC